VRKQNSPTVVRICTMVLTVLSCSAIALAQETAPDFQRSRHNAAVPFIDVISPTAARVHGSGFILILDGAGFGPDAEVGFQLGRITHPLPTLVVNEGELAAYVPARLLKDAATASITVTNRHRHDGDLASNPMQLPITKPTASVAFKQTNITLGEDPGGGIVTADFNGDGRPDLAISEPCGAEPVCFSNTSGHIVILLGRRDGTFFVAPSVTVGNIPSALATGDFNGDGKIDIAVANNGGSSVTILLNDGHGGFTPVPSTVPVEDFPNSIAVGDFNRDGKLDLAVTNSGNVVCSPAGCQASAVSIRLGNGDGTFTAAASIEGTGNTPENVTVADLNRDGILDLVLEIDTSPYVFVYLGQGDGTFSAVASPPVPPVGDSTPALSLGDVNRNGNLDLVFTVQDFPGSGQSTISTVFGNGNGLFHAGPTSPVVNDTLIQGMLADFNGDGKLDFAEQVGFSSMRYDFFLGNGHGKFNLDSSLTVSDKFIGIGPVIADFNGDGKLDLATVTGENGGTVSILLQQ
jgi:hypothetical protein